VSSSNTTSLASMASRPDCLICPLCEASPLRLSGCDSMGCVSCGGRLSGAMLATLRGISALPEALGSHACEECGHPEMRLLPDDTFHCPACGSEVLPIGAPLVDWKSGEHGEAYWCGWLDGRYRDRPLQGPPCGQRSLPGQEYAGSRRHPQKALRMSRFAVDRACNSRKEGSP
jgi:hypothetical protein